MREMDVEIERDIWGYKEREGVMWVTVVKERDGVERERWVRAGIYFE
jgi:hypothetical protein